MRRAIFPFLCTVLLAACAGDFSPVIADDGTADDDATGTDGADTSGSDESGSDESGGTGGGSGEDTSSSGGSDSGSSDESGDDTGELPPENPGPEEPCDPVLAAQGMQTCEAPDGDTRTYSCTPVVVDKTPGPEFADVWGFRCAVLDDSQGDGSDWGDFCSTGEWRTTESWTNGCQESLCLQKFSNAQNPQLGQKVLPDDLCGIKDPNLPGTTACCTEMCKIGSGDCGPGMKCIGQGAMSMAEYVETEAPVLGVCVAQDYDPQGP